MSRKLGSVVFDLTFLNEVTRRHYYFGHSRASDRQLHISRPIIRVNHLVQKIPLYFDEIPSSKPYLSQPVVPVTTPVTSRARCCGTQSCDTSVRLNAATGVADSEYSTNNDKVGHPETNGVRPNRLHRGLPPNGT